MYYVEEVFESNPDFAEIQSSLPYFEKMVSKGDKRRFAMVHRSCLFF
jgi:hypothetical protein